MDAASQLSKFFAENFIKIAFPYGTSLGLILENFEKWTGTVLPDILQRDQKGKYFLQQIENQWRRK